MLEKLEIKEWLGLNAKLQNKKNALRQMLAEKGVLQKDSINTYDNYKYFSEAQYKKLFTELFSKVRLELKFTELAYDTFEGSAKQSNGRMPRLEFTLFDCETGFYEKTCITGEGIDKGDKAGYKAYTGALKYYLANTFMVATGDDPEKETPDENMSTKKVQIKQEPKNIDDTNNPYNLPNFKPVPKKINEHQLQILLAQNETIRNWAINLCKVNALNELTEEQANVILDKMREKGVIK